MEPLGSFQSPIPPPKKKAEKPGKEEESTKKALTDKIASETFGTGADKIKPKAEEIASKKIKNPSPQPKTLSSTEEFLEDSSMTTPSMQKLSDSSEEPTSQHWSFGLTTLAATAGSITGYFFGKEVRGAKGSKDLQKALRVYNPDCLPTENMHNLEIYSLSKAWKDDIRTAKIYYNSSQLKPEEASFIICHQEPTNSLGIQEYDPQKLQAEYGYDRGAYNNPSAKKQNGRPYTDLPNTVSKYGQTVLWNEQGEQHIACLLLPAPALDSPKQSHFNYYVTNGVLETNRYKDEMHFLFLTLENALRDNQATAFNSKGIKRVVLSQFGQGSFLAALSETEKNKARDIFFSELIVFLKKTKGLGVKIVMSEFEKSKNTERLEKEIEVVYGDIVETAKEGDLIGIPSNQHSAPGHNNRPESFEGSMGAKSGMLLVLSPWTNPNLRGTDTLVPVIQEEEEIGSGKIGSFSIDIKGKVESIYRGFEKIAQRFSKEGVLIYMSQEDCSREGVREGRKFWFNAENFKFVMEKFKGSREEFTLEQLKNKFNIIDELETQALSPPTLQRKEKTQFQPPEQEAPIDAIKEAPLLPDPSLTELVAKMGGKVVNNEKAISEADKVKYEFFIIPRMKKDGSLDYQYQSYYKNEYGGAYYKKNIICKQNDLENEISETLSIEYLAKKHNILIVDNMDSIQEAAAANKRGKIGFDTVFMFKDGMRYRIYNKQRNAIEDVLVNLIGSDKEGYHDKLDKAFEANKAGGVLVERVYYGAKNDLFDRETVFDPGKFKFLLYPSETTGKYRMLISKERTAPTLLISQNESIEVAYEKLRKQYEVLNAGPLAEVVSKMGGKVVSNEKAISAEDSVKYGFFIIPSMTMDGNLVYQYQSYYKNEYGGVYYKKYIPTSKIEVLEKEISEIITIEELAKKHKILILDDMRSVKQAVAQGKGGKIGLDTDFMFISEKNRYCIYNKKSQMMEPVLVDSTESDKIDYYNKLDKAFEANKAGGVLVEKMYYGIKNDLFDKEAVFSSGKFKFLLYPSEEGGYRMLISKDPKAPKLLISQNESIEVAYDKLRKQYEAWLKSAT